MKLDFDTIYMAMCVDLSQRSIDPSTKCGCIVVSEDNAVLSMGYNGPPADCPDHLIPLTRPEKYRYFNHAERNAIDFAARHGVSLLGSTFYITGAPCVDCFRSILNQKPKRILNGNGHAVLTDSDQEYQKTIDLLNTSANQSPSSLQKKVKIEQFNLANCASVWEASKKYLEEKGILNHETGR